jgi:hypothetical protein
MKCERGTDSRSDASRMIDVTEAIEVIEMTDLTEVIVEMMDLTEQ